MSPNQTPAPKAPEERPLEEARQFAIRPGLDPLEVRRHFVDLAWIRRGLDHQARAAARWN